MRTSQFQLFAMGLITAASYWLAVGTLDPPGYAAMLTAASVLLATRGKR
jgi:hypothetical protein